MAPRPSRKWTTFVHQLPKHREPPSSNRDVAYVHHDTDARVIVCDGTTSGWDSGWWAWLLASELGRAIARSPVDDMTRALARSVSNARATWARHPRPIKNEATRLYASEAARRLPGAATVAAVVVREDGDALLVTGLAVGDTYIAALVPDGHGGWKAVRATPSLQAFDSTPQVIYAEGGGADVIGRGVESFEWRLPTTAALIVGTDALMKWSFRAAADTTAVWSLLANLDAGRFSKLVHGLRASREIENDDTTLVQLRRVVR